MTSRPWAGGLQPGQRICSKKKAARLGGFESREETPKEGTAAGGSKKAPTPLHQTYAAAQKDQVPETRQIAARYRAMLRGPAKGQTGPAGLAFEAVPAARISGHGSRCLFFSGQNRGERLEPRRSRGIDERLETRPDPR